MKWLNAVSTAVLLLAVCGEVRGSDIPSLYGTGVAADGSLLVDGIVDPHYTLITVPTGSGYGPSAFAVNSSGYPFSGGWLADGPTSKWIGPQAAGTALMSEGAYVYRTTFDLGGYVPATATIAGQWCADNCGQDILINGVSTGITTSGEMQSYGQFSPFTIATGFISGINTLDFVVYNAPPGGSSNPTGLRVEMTSASANRLSTITTTTGAPPNTLSNALKPINPTVTPPSGQLKRWNGQSWDTVNSWSDNDNGIDPTQPTVVLAHGWKTDDITNFFAANSSISELATSLRAKSPLSGNILAWDWQSQAVSKPGQPMLKGLDDIKQEGLNGAAASARRGVDQGVLLAHELQGLHISNDNLQLIGHSNGGAVVGSAASELALSGQKVERLTTLDTPNLSLGEIPAAAVWYPILGIREKMLSTSVNATQYVHASTASQTEVYYSGLEAGRNAFGFGEALPSSSGNNRFNGLIYPGTVSDPSNQNEWDHLRIIDWYTKDRTGTPVGPNQFTAGIDWSLLSAHAADFTPGTYSEQSLNSGVFGQFNPAQLQPVPLKKVWWDGFDTGSNAVRSWLGQHAELFTTDGSNYAVKLFSGSDGYLYRDVTIPGDASYLTFDLKIETPDAGDFLTVTLGNEIVYYKPLNTADSDFSTVDPIFIGDFAGQTETLLFTLNHVGDGAPSILLDNITFSAVPDPSTLGLLLTASLGLVGVVFHRRRRGK